KGGRFRDINEPRQSDYIDGARAVLAKFKELTAEPTEAMIEAAKQAVISQKTDIYTAMNAQMWKDIGI
ncbi:MAG: hypothetical protein ACRCVX_13315, partial [Shewanella sp.]